MQKSVVSSEVIKINENTITFFRKDYCYLLHILDESVDMYFDFDYDIFINRRSGDQT